MEEFHTRIAKIAGEISMALIHSRGTRSMVKDWAERLRSIADDMEQKYGK